MAFSLALALFLGNSTAWMLGKTPPWAMVTPARSLFSSSSFLMASCRCLGMMRDFLLSLAALPASSKISAARYSMTAGKKLVQFFVIPDSQLKMPRDDARLLIVPSSITSKLQDLCGQIFHDCRHVDWSTSSNSLGIVTLPEQPVDPAHWELKSSPTGARLCLSLDLTTLSAPRHLNQRGCKKSLKTS